MQGGFEHELHAFVVAWAPTAHTPISRSLAEQNANFLMAGHAEKWRKIRLWVEKACIQQLGLAGQLDKKRLEPPP